MSSNNCAVGSFAAPAAVDTKPLKPLPIGGVDARFKPKLIRNLDSPSPLGLSKYGWYAARTAGSMACS